MPNRQQTKQMVPNHRKFFYHGFFFSFLKGELNRLLPVSGGRQQRRVPCLPELPGSGMTSEHRDPHYSLCSGGVHGRCFLPLYPERVDSAPELTAVLCHSLSCSLPGQGAVQLVSAGNVCLNVYSALFMLEKERSKHVLRARNGGRVIRDLAHGRSHGYVHVLTYVPLPLIPLGPETALSKSSCSFRWPSEVRAALEGMQT